MTTVEDYMTDETHSVFDHEVRKAYDTHGNILYECQTCGVVDSEVIRFDRQDCISDE